MADSGRAQRWRAASDPRSAVRRRLACPAAVQ